MYVILSSDDFYASNHGFKHLDALNEYFDNFKITVFCIPTCLPEEWVKAEVLTRPYLKVALHGYYHTMFECQDWDTVTAVKNITEAEEAWTVKGFKPPFWIDSEGTLEACHRLGYWVAVNPDAPPYGKMPDGLKLFYHDTDIHQIPEEWDKKYLKLHSHIQNVCSNGIAECFDEIKRIPKNMKFMWIDDYITKTGGDPFKWDTREDIHYDCYSLGTHPIFGGDMKVGTINRLWDLVINQGGPVLQIGGGPATVILSLATKELVINTTMNFQFDMQGFVNKHEMRLLTIGDPTDPETPKKIPQGFKAGILFIDIGGQDPSILKTVYEPFLRDGGIIILKNGDSFVVVERQGKESV